MLKVLLVDDEKTILQGISMLVEWEKLGTALIGTAMNGSLAYDMVLQETPDIIITDIKMPIMNGLELIKKVKHVKPKVKFIILSGHEEFDFAKQAMEFGVQHYLLKPCNPQKISTVLDCMTKEIAIEHKKESDLQQTMYQLEKVKPHAEEQFLREMLINRSYGEQEWAEHIQMNHRSKAPEAVKLLVLQIERTSEHMYLFALKNILVELLERTSSFLLSTLLDGKVVIAVNDQQNSELIPVHQQATSIFEAYYKYKALAVISRSGAVGELRRLYKEAELSLKHHFFYGEGSVIAEEPQIQGGKHITGGSVSEAEDNNAALQEADLKQLAAAVRSGDLLTATGLVEQSFASMAECNFSIEQIKREAAALYMAVIKQADANEQESLYKQIMELQELQTLVEMKSWIKDAAEQIIEQFFNDDDNAHNDIVRNMLRYARENIADESFSLYKLANEMMYMNADYIGKLFRRHTGHRFKSYIVIMRMDRAKKLIDQAEDIKMNEIAEQVGFGNNPKYFSQVFKKETGYTPSEYKKRGLQ
ncbi:response regulator [Paenibacillus sp. IITD108]|uniref:response regulator n=1 Tax=Paenibacillus sp. IITD108 TaxID=3116649 RepID=UPI002F3EB254